MKRHLSFGILFIVFFLQGCTVPFHIAPPGVKVAAPPANIEDPDKYLVDSAKYPVFRIKQQFTPPTWKAGSVTGYPMGPIEPADIWKVTHQLGNVLLIYSETYNDRQCRYLARLAPNGMAGGFIGLWSSTCQSSYLYHVPITLDGTVKSNWMLLYNPRRVGFSRDRYINMQIDPTTAEGWGPQPLFEPIR